LLGERGEVNRATKHKANLLPANKLLPTDSVATLFTNVRRTQQDEKLLALAKILEPRLKQIELLQNGLEIEIHGHLEGLGQPLPFSSLGEGMRRIISLLLNLATTENGIVLIDEIENGLHHSVQVDVWNAIAEAARAYNVQVFATTHSYEMISAAHEAHKEVKPFDFRLFGLRRNRESNEIRAVSYDEETLDAAVDMYLEMR
jgi:AAA15 family ATPase/GTPase